MDGRRNFLDLILVATFAWNGKYRVPFDYLSGRGSMVPIICENLGSRRTKDLYPRY